MCPVQLCTSTHCFTRLHSVAQQGVYDGKNETDRLVACLGRVHPDGILTYCHEWIYSYTFHWCHVWLLFGTTHFIFVGGEGETMALSPK